MRPHRTRSRFSSRVGRRAQRGVIMIFTMIALVLMLIAVAAMVRTTGTSTSVIGNLAFRRDLTNRAEIAIAQAKTSLNTTGFSYITNSTSAHYSATRLDSPAGGIGVPTVLVSDSAYTAAGYTCIGGTGTVLTNCVAGSDGVVIRWIIDRQCVLGTGNFDISLCGYLTASKDTRGTNFLASRKPNGANRALYRISVRVTGPRNNESYIQASAG